VRCFAFQPGAQSSALDRLLCEGFHTARMSSLTIPGVNLQHKEFRSFSVNNCRGTNRGTKVIPLSERLAITGGQGGCIYFPRLHPEGFFQDFPLFPGEDRLASSSVTQDHDKGRMRGQKQEGLIQKPLSWLRTSWALGRKTVACERFAMRSLVVKYGALGS